MKKWLMLIALLFGLTACSNSDKKVEVKQEKLHSFLIVQDKLYVVGEIHDYQFEHDLVKNLNGFLNSPYEKFIKKIDISFDVKMGGSAVEGIYDVTLDMSSQPKSEREKVVKQYGFTNYSSDGSKIAKFYHANGDVVKLENRAEILQKYQFKQPIPAKLTYSGELSDGAETALGIIALPVTIPLGLAIGVLALPFQLVCLGGLICGY